MTAVTSSEAENFIYTQRDTFVYIHNTDFLQFCSILLIHFLAEEKCVYIHLPGYTARDDYTSLRLTEGLKNS